MYLPCNDRVIGLVNIMMKAESLILYQVMKVSMNKDSNWVNFGHTYLGILLRRFEGCDFQNNRPHCIEETPPFL